ncbi:MAG TPA: DNA starvation/stationary phase protection protein [Burkholderiales bacterium]|nr:DNA starvation/stationary phase protection protein [Burkholderiales bacterium]
MSIQIGLNDNQRKASIDILNRLLADEVTLYVKTRNFHWNVEGLQFSELHKFFEEQYDELDEIMDEVAERARALDGYAAGSLGEFVAAARIKEAKGTRRAAKEMIAELLADHETLIRNLRTDAQQVGEKHGDAGTEDFLVGLMEQHEKMAWMLRAYLA